MPAEFNFKPVPKKEQRILNKLFKKNPLLREQMMAALFGDDQKEVVRPTEFTNGSSDLWSYAIAFFFSNNEDARKRLEDESWM